MSTTNPNDSFNFYVDALLIFIANPNQKRYRNFGARNFEDISFFHTLVFFSNANHVIYYIFIYLAVNPVTNKRDSDHREYITWLALEKNTDAWKNDPIFRPGFQAG